MLSLTVLQMLIPTAEISTLLVTFLFRSLLRLNDSFSAYKPIEKDGADDLKRRRRPQGVLLLLPLLAITFTYIGDGGLLLLDMMKTKQRPDIGIFYALASLSVYWTSSVMLLRGEETERLPIFLITGYCEFKWSVHLETLFHVAVTSAILGQISILVTRIWWRAQGMYSSNQI